MATAPKTGDKSASPAQKAATTAHLLETTAHQLAHTKRHLVSLRKSKNARAKALDMDHADTHMDGGIEHVQKLMSHMKANYPAEGKELDNLQNTVARSDIGKRVQNAHKAIKKLK